MTIAETIELTKKVIEATIDSMAYMTDKKEIMSAMRFCNKRDKFIKNLEAIEAM